MSRTNELNTVPLKVTVVSAPYAYGIGAMDRPLWCASAAIGAQSRAELPRGAQVTGGKLYAAGGGAGDVKQRLDLLVPRRDVVISDGPAVGFARAPCVLEVLC